jgi:hypothetical protein
MRLSIGICFGLASPIPHGAEKKANIFFAAAGEAMFA